MRRTLLALLLGTVAAAVAPAHADERTLLVSLGARQYARDQESAVRAVARLAGGDVAVLRLGDDAPCWPGDAACAVSLLRAHHATRLVLVRVVSERRGCVPTAGGGHRQLVGPQLAIEILDASGRSLAHDERTLDHLTATDAAAAQLARALLAEVPSAP